jgi:hypothetical protein
MKEANSALKHALDMGVMAMETNDELTDIVTRLSCRIYVEEKTFKPQTKPRARKKH